ncbi:MAG TPA: Gfo/Idh/MocA family oxidoreductase [Pirellulales bacterium]|nr:Gfo/Idh/MocA family oxidoreductase [Pirellulales bacterium]
MSPQPNRRQFVRTAAVTGLGLAASAWSAPRALGANERLDLGVIGVGGRGAADLDAVSAENIVALCDVDEDRLNQAARRFPAAKRYADYRQLLDEAKLDAVVVATPDHHHAPAAIRALKRGLHVYCEKPLTHTVAEARLMAQLAAEKKVATQMGTQNHEHPGYLRLVELIRSGAIGAVREVHVITDRPGTFWKQGLDRPTEKPPAPAGLDWNLWLGPAAERPYHPAYAPFAWRGWWDFGCGAIGDMAIHLMDPAFWALKLGGPVKVTSQGPPPLGDSGPTWMISRFEFGERDGLPGCDVFWYEGTAMPRADVAAMLPMNGSLFIGDEGKIAIRHDKEPVLLPEEKFRDFKGPDAFLPRSPGHHQQWIEACKTGSPTGSNFRYAGPFTEIVLLGNVAYRAGKTVTYDPKTVQIIDVPEANQLLSKEYRKGWEV